MSPIYFYISLKRKSFYKLHCKKAVQNYCKKYLLQWDMGFIIFLIELKEMPLLFVQGVNGLAGGVDSGLVQR